MNLLTSRQKLQRLVVMAQELQDMFPNCNPSLAADANGVRLGLHACHSYDTATNMMRALGFGKRDKQTLPIGKTGRTTLTGRDDMLHITVTAYCDELPPTCHIVTTTTKVKRRKRVQSAEYDIVDKPMRSIVCVDPQEAA